MKDEIIIATVFITSGITLFITSFIVNNADSCGLLGCGLTLSLMGIVMALILTITK